MNLPSRAEYDAATPWEKGYMSYMFAKWPNSEIPEECPFAPESEDGPFSPEFYEWLDGQNCAVAEAQDSEE